VRIAALLPPRFGRLFRSTIEPERREQPLLGAPPVRGGIFQLAMREASGGVKNFRPLRGHKNNALPGGTAR